MRFPYVAGTYIPDHFLTEEQPPEDGVYDRTVLRYFDAPLPADDSRGVVRAVNDNSPHSNYCSTRVRKAHVRVPRVSILEAA